MRAKDTRSDCSFRDLTKNSEGKIQSVMVINDNNEAFFEMFTVFIEKPVEKTIRIEETEISEGDSPFTKFN